MSGAGTQGRSAGSTATVMASSWWPSAPVWSKAPRPRSIAGCGIVADSDPEREWDESSSKLQALGSALGPFEP